MARGHRIAADARAAMLDAGAAKSFAVGVVVAHPKPAGLRFVVVD
jgi:hypothetical protein